jgi:hypothetical protein
MISETARRQQLRLAGYAPIPVQGKASPLTGWSKKTDANPEEIALWSRTFPSATNTGLLTGTMPVLDIDILNPEAAEAIEALARERFEERGYVLTRIGLSPKRAILLRTDKPFKKITGNVVAPNGDNKQKIELLADGQQVVAFGIHPDTRKPYAWFGGEPGPIKYEDLPYISESEAKKLVADALKVLVSEFNYTLQSPRSSESDKGNSRDSTNWAALIGKSRMAASCMIQPATLPIG